MRKLRLAGVNRLDQSGHRRARQSQDSSPCALSSYGPCRKKRRHPVGETGIDIKKRQREVVRGCEDRAYPRSAGPKGKRNCQEVRRVSHRRSLGPLSVTTVKNPTDRYKQKKDSNGLCVESLGDRRASVGIRYANHAAATCLSSFLGLLSSQVGKLSPLRWPRAASYQHLLRKPYLSNSCLTSPKVEPDWVTCSSLKPIAVGRRQKELIGHSHPNPGGLPHCVCSRSWGEAILQRKIKVHHQNKEE